MTTELRECAHCGGAASEIEEEDVVLHEPYTHSIPGYLVACATCGARSGGEATQEQAIAAWNRRPEDARIADVEARWKAQRESIIQTLEEWEAAHDDRPEYQSAISDVLAWLNGDMP